jgi:hypothetical protein
VYQRQTGSGAFVPRQVPDGNPRLEKRGARCFTPRSVARRARWGMKSMGGTCEAHGRQCSVGCERPAAPYINGMLHIVVILVIGIGLVCHMIGDKHTIHRRSDRLP